MLTSSTKRSWNSSRRLFFSSRPATFLLFSWHSDPANGLNRAWDDGTDSLSFSVRLETDLHSTKCLFPFPSVLANDPRSRWQSDIRTPLALSPAFLPTFDSILRLP